MFWKYVEENNKTKFNINKILDAKLKRLNFKAKQL